jgi:hypothetical protein
VTGDASRRAVGVRVWALAAAALSERGSEAVQGAGAAHEAARQVTGMYLLHVLLSSPAACDRYGAALFTPQVRAPPAHTHPKHTHIHTHRNT